MSYNELGAIDPYYDDFENTKNYLRILFNPGRAVQARELTQAQTILHSQISKFSSHIFADGSRVLGAKINVDNEKYFLLLDELDSGASAVDVRLWLDATIIGQTSGAIATVDAIDEATRALFISYQGGEFVEGEQLITEVSLLDAYISTGGIGQSVHAYVDEGIIYLNESFVVVGVGAGESTVIVDKVKTDGSYKIGFTLSETVVTSADDSSLNDPATGAYNFNAPGADRYKVSALLESYEDTGTGYTLPDNFVTVIEYEDGVLIKSQKLVEYSTILETLARRTFDESGNYTVKDFPIEVHEHTTDTTKVTLQIDSGKAYVRGYEVETIAPIHVDVDKARTFDSLANTNVSSDYGVWIPVASIDDFHGLFNIAVKETVEFMTTTDGTGTGKKIVGEGNIDAIEFVAGKYRIHLSNVSQLYNAFSSVRSVRSKSTPTTYATVEVDSVTGLSYINDKDKSVLVYPMIHTFVKELTLDQVSYYVYKNFTNLSKDGGGNFVITAPDVFTDFDSTESYVMIIDSATGLPITTGVAVVTNTGDTQTSYLTISGITETNIDIIVKLYRRKGNWKTKTLTERTRTISTDVNGVLTFPDYDIFEIISVHEDPLGINTDVTANAILDDGQRDTFYDVGSLSGLTPSTSHSVVFRHFTHSGTGDYFSINSYLNATNESFYTDFYARVGLYSAADGSATYALGDVIDFRRTQADINAGVYLFSPKEAVNLTYDYYLPRIDKLYVDPYGTFGVVSGVPSLTPEEPVENDGVMFISTLSIAPYTISIDSVVSSPIDTKNFTMSDIGELERRIENLEYYSAMNLLEQNAKELRFTDTNGFDKFKNGILVDNFTGHDVGDSQRGDYRCAVDPENEELRSEFDITSVDFVDSGASVNMTEHENIATVSYTTTEYINQPQASETINVNPYNVFIWEGTLRLIPAFDNWVDTTRKPDLIVNHRDSKSAWVNAESRARSFGVEWGWWKTKWIGQPKTIASWNSTEVSLEGGFGFNNRTITTTTRNRLISTPIGSQRTGIKTVVRPKETRKKLGDRVINTSVVPWIRAKTVTYKAWRMKPSTTVKAYFDSVDVSAYCTNLVTDSNGYVTGTFAIPAGMFRTGERLFRLADDALSNPTTSAETTYVASGLRKQVEGTILSIVSPELVKEQVTQNAVFSSLSTTSTSSTATTTQTRWGDPLAQSFLISGKKGGVFLSSIDLYFQSKDNRVPVTVRIVENVNGYPSQKIVPFSEVTLNPASVTVTGNETTPTVATNFTFSDPIYLMDGVEYSFVIISNSNKYNVFVGKIGDKKLGTTKIITKQPYAGVMFKSQNASTWTADQDRDIMFKINRCVFSTSPATYELNSELLGYDQNITSMTFNINHLKFDNTLCDWEYKFATSNAVPFENKTTNELVLQKTINVAADLQIIGYISTLSSNISPVISMKEISSIITNNDVLINDPQILYNGQNYYDAGTYITRTTNLVNPSDDLKMIIDANKPAGTEIAAYFKSGAYIPRYVGISDTVHDSLQSTTMYLYWETAGVATMKSSAYISLADAAQSRYYLKSISDISAFEDPADWATLSVDNMFMAEISDIDTITDEGGTWSGSPYSLGDFVWYNSLLWECAVTSTVAEPTVIGTDWNLIKTSTISSVVTEDEEMEWQELTLEGSNAYSTDFIEYTYKPKEDIIDDFSTFAVKIVLLASNPATIPKCKNLRVLALY